MYSPPRFGRRYHRLKPKPLWRWWWFKFKGAPHYYALELPSIYVSLSTAEGKWPEVCRQIASLAALLMAEAGSSVLLERALFTQVDHGPLAGTPRRHENELPPRLFSL
jgi:hypothetical protein